MMQEGYKNYAISLWIILKNDINNSLLYVFFFWEKGYEWNYLEFSYFAMLCGVSSRWCECPFVKWSEVF